MQSLARGITSAPQRCDPIRQEKDREPRCVRRPGLDLRTRLLTAVAALAAVGDSEVPLGNHIRYALNVGCTREEIVETVMQVSVYAGFPRAVKGLAVVEKVLAERGGERGSR
ncbi:carboxymuconolactone decarboxylase family protein [Sorangium sp. So ce131]|uniref:carboxymuconolactone decarboxylase family protein n=1 Tax=Sorangium sp. So ce131 TaxID=3133282 RepID=UPI003F6352B6